MIISQFRLIGLISILSFLFLFACKQKESTLGNKLMPQPFETVVKEDMEDYHHKAARQEWFDLLHTAAPGDDWKKIEQQNRIANTAYRADLRTQVQTRDGEVSIADGKHTGKWKERGSNNQAGNITMTAFDSSTDQIYCVSGGGSIYRGNLDGSDWTPINEDIQFHDRFLVLIPEGKRLVSAIFNQPHYSDDNGQTWIPSEGITGGTDATITRVVHIESTDEIFLTYKDSANEPYRLYYSDDAGVSFRSVYNYNTTNRNNFYITHTHDTDYLHSIEQLTGSITRIHQWHPEEKVLKVLNDDSKIGFGASGRANLVTTVNPVSQSIIFKSYNEINNVHTSIDTGKTWIPSEEPIPETPWEVTMSVSKHDPNHLQAGGVESFRSYDGGNTWFLVNSWGSYYGDPATRLHADIMYYDEYTSSTGEDFVLNMNHGGIYISYDNGITYKNIGQDGLNVSQYYSVRSLPSNPTVVFAGAQDQGFQRGTIDFNQEGPSDLEQAISGDYGHIVFTNNGSSLWTVYPFGWISFYRNPIDGGIDASYTIESNNETVWIPPIVADPNPNKNIVYAAGGSAEGGSGSYIIKLEVMPDNSIEANNLPYNFADSGGTIAAIGIDYINPDKWYVSTTNRKYYYSLDRGQTFNKVAIPVPGSQYLYGAHIYSSKSDDKVVYMAGSGYSNPGVVKSIDGGITYSNMSSGLPSTNVFDLAVTEDDRYAFAATEAGPYMYLADENKWYELAQTAAPQQTYWSVEIVPFTDIVRFGTYGRGIWDFELTSGPLVSSTKEVESEAANHSLNVYPNPASDVITIKTTDNTLMTSVSIFDTQGRQMSNQNINDTQVTIGVTQYTPGNYIIKARVGGKLLIKQFIKQ